MVLDDDPDSMLGHEARLLWWEMAIARKLRDTAFSERRMDDVNYYDKQLQAATQRARRLLGLPPSNLTRN